jgi:NlpC/P60 family putative phage cell wall peptidase
VSVARAELAGADPARIVACARAWLGTPYHDQASLKGAGVDCLGLARGIWRDCVGPEPAPVPPHRRDWGETGDVEVMAVGVAVWMVPIALTEAKPGSLVLFRMLRGAIAKHAGILTVPGSFIHAHSKLGVVEEPLTESWRRRLAFAFAFPLTVPQLGPQIGEGGSWQV